MRQRGRDAEGLLDRRLVAGGGERLARGELGDRHEQTPLVVVRAVQHGNLDLRAERQLRKRHRKVAEQIGTVAREDRVVAGAHEDVEVACGSTVDAGAAFAGQP